jgi:chromosome segregation ATPase
MTPRQTQAAVREEYQTLHNALTEARERCTDLVKRTELRRRAEEVQAMLTALDRQDLQSRTAGVKELAAQIRGTNENLARLKDEIDSIVNDLACATKVLSAIQGVLNATEKFLA